MRITTIAALLVLAACSEKPKAAAREQIRLAGQPSPADFEQARKDGVRTVINLRHPAEQPGFDEKARVESLGLAYHGVPWNGSAELTDAKFAEVHALLKSAERPLILHCASANRTGPHWIVYRVLEDGLSVDDAVAEAKAAGLRSADYEAKARDYLKRHGGR